MIEEIDYENLYEELVVKYNSLVSEYNSLIDENRSLSDDYYDLMAELGRMTEKLEIIKTITELEN